jgi:hypothetical protein
VSARKWQMFVRMKLLSAGKFQLQGCDPWMGSEVLHTVTKSDLTYVQERISEIQIIGNPCTSKLLIYLKDVVK